MNRYQEKLKEWAEEEAAQTHNMQGYRIRGAYLTPKELLEFTNLKLRIQELNTLQHVVKTMDQYKDIDAAIEASAYHNVIGQICAGDGIMDTRVEAMVKQLRSEIEKLKK